MKRKPTPSTPKRMTLVQAMKAAGQRKKRNPKRMTVKRRIIDAVGKDLPLLIELMTDKDTSGAYIHRVLNHMGIRCSYPYVQQVLREEFAAEYGWFQDIVGCEYPEPRPIVHHIPRSAFTAMKPAVDAELEPTER